MPWRKSLTLVDWAGCDRRRHLRLLAVFLPAIVDEMNSTYQKPGGGTFRRLAQFAYNLEDPAQLDAFLKGDKREVTVPGSGRRIAYDPLPRIGVGLSKLGTSEAVAIGAYAFALRQLDASGANP